MISKELMLKKGPSELLAEPFGRGIEFRKDSIDIQWPNHNDETIEKLPPGVNTNIIEEQVPQILPTPLPNQDHSTQMNQSNNNFSFRLYPQCPQP
jgi:hypothetical protein